jgi:hypothetical protein
MHIEFQELDYYVILYEITGNRISAVSHLLENIKNYITLSFRLRTPGREKQ